MTSMLCVHPDHRAPRPVCKVRDAAPAWEPELDDLCRTRRELYEHLSDDWQTIPDLIRKAGGDVPTLYRTYFNAIQRLVRDGVAETATRLAVGKSGARRMSIHARLVPLGYDAEAHAQIRARKAGVA